MWYHEDVISERERGRVHEEGRSTPGIGCTRTLLLDQEISKDVIILSVGSVDYWVNYRKKLKI